MALADAALELTGADGRGGRRRGRHRVRQPERVGGFPPRPLRQRPGAREPAHVPEPRAERTRPATSRSTSASAVRTSRSSRGEASGEAALALAYDTIVTGQADVLLAGGGDELAPVLASDLRRPRPALADRRRRASGAAPSIRAGTASSWAKAPRCWCSRARAHAAARGARVYAELAGHASESLPASPHDWPTRRRPPRTRRRHRRAARRARLRPRPRGALRRSSSRAPTRPARLDALEAARLAALLGDATPARARDVDQGRRRRVRRGGRARRRRGRARARARRRSRASARSARPTPLHAAARAAADARRRRTASRTRSSRRRRAAAAAVTLLFRRA